MHEKCCYYLRNLWLEKDSEDQIPTRNQHQVACTGTNSLHKVWENQFLPFAISAAALYLVTTSDCTNTALVSQAAPAQYRTAQVCSKRTLLRSASCCSDVSESLSDMAQGYVPASCRGGCKAKTENLSNVSAACALQARCIR